MPGGNVFSLGLWEARRLRGFGGDVGGGASEILLFGGVLLGGSGRTSSMAAFAEVFEEFDFCRLWGGADLDRVRTQTPTQCAGEGMIWQKQWTEQSTGSRIDLRHFGRGISDLMWSRGTAKAIYVVKGSIEGSCGRHGHVE